MGGDNVLTIDAGLPGISGSINIEIGEFAAHTGALYIKRFNGKVSSTQATEISDTQYKNVAFDASKSNEIYGKSDKVLPESFALIAQIKY